MEHSKAAQEYIHKREKQPSYKDLTKEQIKMLSRYDEAIKLTIPEYAGGSAWTLLDVARALEDGDLSDALYHLSLLFQQLMRRVK